MSPRLAVVLGLLAGVLSALLVAVAVYGLAPEIATMLLPSPSPTVSASPISSTAPVPTNPAPGDSPGLGSAEPVPSSTPAPAASGASSASATPNPFGIGRPAPHLVVPKLGGGTFDLAAMQGHPVWVNFMGTYCPPCRDEFPVMNGFAVRYASTGLVVVAVDVGEASSVVEAFASDLGVTFTMALDSDGSAQKAWRAAALPMHFWIDANGIVRAGALGGIGPDQMAADLQTILPGVTVTP